MSETEFTNNEIRRFANTKKALTRAIIHESNLAEEINPNPSDADEEKRYDNYIERIVKILPVAFLFPEEYNDTKKDWDKGLFQYHHSALHKAIKYSDNKTAALIIDKEGVKPENFVIRGKVPSLEHAITSANQEIAEKILAKVRDVLKPQTLEQYEKDFKATFGEEELTQTKPPVKHSPAKQIE